MPKKYGVKEKDLVVSHVVNMVLTGKLRSGDRVDRNEIAHELGVSRVPIQEAVVLEHHELYGFLSGIASARAATDPTPEILERLDTLIGIMRSNRESAKRSTTPTPGRGANASAWCSSTSICFRTAPFWTT